MEIAGATKPVQGPILEIHTTNTTMAGMMAYRRTLQSELYMIEMRKISLNVVGLWSTVGHELGQFTQLIQYENMEHLIRAQTEIDRSSDFLRTNCSAEVVSTESVLTVLAPPQSELYRKFLPSQNGHGVYELQISPRKDGPVELGTEASLVGRFFPLYGHSNKEYQLVRYPTPDAAFTAALHSMNVLPAESERRLLLPLSTSDYD